MPHERRVLSSLRLSPRLPGLAVTTAALFAAYSTAGCLSHEYTIPKEELARVVNLPPQVRGERVRVVQGIGERRADPVPPRPSYYDPTYEPEYYGPDVHVDVGIYGSSGGHGGHYAPPPRGVHVVPPAAGGGTPAAGGPAPPSGPPVGDARPPVNGAPVPAKPVTHGGGLSGVGGGGGGKDDLAVLAVIVAVAAAFCVFGLAVTEGARHDGFAQLHPGQPLHLHGGGGERVVALGDLSREDLASTAEAVVMEDEGYGLRILDRRPLDRVGGTFKMDVGSPTAEFDGQMVGGMLTNIQAGFFPTQRFGLVANLTLSGGSDPQGQTFTRHALSIEPQFFPVKLGPVHLGLYGDLGKQLVTQGGQPRLEGTALGGGVLMEIEMTTRMALTLRGGWTNTYLETGRWMGTGTVALGIAVY
jgi:hypothetical protein